MRKIILFITMLLLTINLHGAIRNDSTISIILKPITSGTIVNHTDIAYGTDLIDLDVSHLPSGSYAVSYSVNSDIIDSCKFNK